MATQKDLPRNGNNPALLYGYGGFNDSLTPYFSTAQLVRWKTAAFSPCRTCMVASAKLGTGIGLGLCWVKG
ncbi:MAG: hypothetical protein PVG22_14020 [Chromatiales bacterium]